MGEKLNCSANMRNIILKQHSNKQCGAVECTSVVVGSFKGVGWHIESFNLYLYLFDDKLLLMNNNSEWSWVSYVLNCCD